VGVEESVLPLEVEPSSSDGRRSEHIAFLASSHAENVTRLSRQAMTKGTYLNVPHSVGSGLLAAFIRAQSAAGATLSTMQRFDHS
jgi:hypothetical protein